MIDEVPDHPWVFMDIDDDGAIEVSNHPDWPSRVYAIITTVEVFNRYMQSLDPGTRIYRARSVHPDVVKHYSSFPQVKTIVNWLHSIETTEALLKRMKEHRRDD